MPLYEVGGNRPAIDTTAFVHPDAVLLGRVEIGPRCYVGPGAVLRGDWVSIRVGAGSNIQDNCVIHGNPGGEVVLEEHAHLGHGCIVHNAHVGCNALIGMAAVISDDVELGEDSIVGAGALVTAGMVVPAGMLAVGAPARVVGEVRRSLAEYKRLGTVWYQALADRCLEDVRPVQLADCLVGEPEGAELPVLEGSKESPGERPRWLPWIEQTDLFRAGTGEEAGGGVNG